MSDRVAVVGGGISGLACARVLVDAGIAVQVFDKGRGPGGRVATRKNEAGSFDHGAQYFTARGDSFRGIVSGWREAGIVAPWKGSLVVLDRGRTSPPRGETERLVGVPGMSALGRALAEGIPVAQGVRVLAVRGREDAWSLEHEEGTEGPFARVVLALPPDQATGLAPSLAPRTEGVAMSPCWALLTAYPERLPLDFDGGFVENSPLSWVARDGSKPGRPSGERWVLHASPGWSGERLEEDPVRVGSALLDAFAEAAGRALPEPDHRTLHRWRYALPRTPLPDPYVLGEDGLAACGDWCDGPRIEGAWRSGTTLGGVLVRGLRSPA